MNKYKSTYWENEGKIFSFSGAIKLMFDFYYSKFEATEKLFYMICDIYDRILTDDQKLELLNIHGSWEEVKEEND